MAAVIFKYTTDKAKVSSKERSSGYLRGAAVEEFLAGKGWISIGSQVLHSEPSFGTAKEQMLSQARALWDIEELVKSKSSVKEYFKDSLIIVGQVYDIDSLMEIRSVKKDTKKERKCKQSLLLDLESPAKECPVKSDRVSPNEGTTKPSIANAMKAIKLGPPKVKSPASPKTKNTIRPVRIRPMGSASKVTSRPIANFPRTPVKTAKTKPATSTLMPGHSSSDVNSNLLSEAGSSKDHEEDDMTPLYLTCLAEEDADGGKMAQCACEINSTSYRVETFVKKESCAKKLCCTNINVDPSERVVV